MTPDLDAYRAQPDGEEGAAVATQARIALRAAARTIGGRQIQERATVVGNVCNASPAADGMPNLLALDAQVEVMSGAASTPTVPGAGFIGTPPRILTLGALYVIPIT